MIENAKEYWLPAKEDPTYEVSNFGNVRNRETGRYLTPHDNKPNGYLRVSLHGTKHYVHRLVAHAFFDQDPSGLDINHIDGDRHNNFIGNLEWCTRKENIQHAIKSGLFKRTCNGLASVEASPSYPAFERVIRCKDCIHRHDNDWCETRPQHFYCADGER